jgi:glycerophosphoryl diester phosphodiesterase
VKTLGKATPILNIAHRGARAYAPENTLAAFAKAKIFGCDMFELDVRLSKDNQIVVHHDENLLRCTNAQDRFPGRDSYTLEDFTYTELSKLDAGSWYCAQLELPNAERQPFLQSLTAAEMADFLTESDRYTYSSGTVKIPTLTESLNLAKALDLMVNVELKSGSAKDSLLVVNVVNVVQDLNMTDKVLISSFHLDLIKQVRQQTKRIPTAALTEKPLKAPITTLRKLRAASCNMGCFWDFNRQGFDSASGKRYLAHLKKLRDAGYEVNVWTCNNPEEMTALINGGVTGLITDYPNRARQEIMAYLEKH